MNNLKNAALQFAREVLGWEGASLNPSDDEVIWNGRNNGHSAGFRYSDLTVVMKAVEDFCIRHHLILKCLHEPHVSKWKVRIFKSGLETTDGIHYVNLTEALLEACLEAADLIRDEDQGLPFDR